MKLPASIASRLLIRACRTMARRDPDFIIGDDYLRRWYLVRDGRRWTQKRAFDDLITRAEGREPKRRGFNIYLHMVRRSDDDRALHTHPWPSCSLILAGSYLEHLPADARYPAGPTVSYRRGPGDVVFRTAGAPHRLEIDGAAAITLFLTGPRLREWGFHCRKGFRHWKEFTSPDDSGQVGRGCGGLE